VREARLEEISGNNISMHRTNLAFGAAFGRQHFLVMSMLDDQI
jgi:hypothetical protein